MSFLIFQTFEKEHQQKASVELLAISLLISYTFNKNYCREWWCYGPQTPFLKHLS